MNRKLLNLFLGVATLLLIGTGAAAQAFGPLAPDAPLGAGFTYRSSTSIAGGYVLSATIGQPDAGAATGGVYVLTGGLWSGSAAAGDALFLPLIRR